MLLVSTNNPNDRKLLQQEFSSENMCFKVPSRHCQTLIEIIKSIGFQFFQNSLPTLAEKVKEIVINSIHMNYSLTLIREVMKIIQQGQEIRQEYQSHFIQMNNAFLGENEQLINNNEDQINLTLDQLYYDSLKGQIHKTENIDKLDFQLYLPQNEELSKINKKEIITETTISSDIEQAITNGNQTFTGNNKLYNLFSSTKNTFSCDQWKTQRYVSHENSKELSSLKKKGINVLECNNELSPLIQQEIKYDITQDLYLSKSTKINKQLEKFMYKKLMKQSLMHSKMRLRKKNE